MPIKLILEPYFPNQRHSAFLKLQINLSDDFKNQLWNKIIRQKIDNSSRNLADDLIEPWRAMVDQIAYGIIGNEFNLSMK